MHTSPLIVSLQEGIHKLAETVMHAHGIHDTHTQTTTHIHTHRQRHKHKIQCVYHFTPKILSHFTHNIILCEYLNPFFSKNTSENGKFYTSFSRRMGRMRVFCLSSSEMSCLPNWYDEFSVCIFLPCSQKSLPLDCKPERREEIKFIF